MNTQQYWWGVRELAWELDPEAHRRDVEERNPALKNKHIEQSGKEIFLTALPNDERDLRGGMVVTAHPYTAALYIKDKTHRLSTETEIADWRKEQERRRAEHDKSEAERRGLASPQGIVDAVIAANNALKPAGRRPAAD